MAHKPTEAVRRPPAMAPVDGRSRILAVALEAFSRRGYAEISMQEIADAAGLTKAAVYYHFADKDGLFGEVFRREMERLCAGIVDQLALGGTLRRQLERVAAYLLDAGRVDFVRLVADLNRYVAPQRRCVLVEGICRPDIVVRAAFARAQAAGEIGSVDPDVAVSLFFSLVCGQVRFEEIGWGAPGDSASRAATIASVLVRGIEP